MDLENKFSYHFLEGLTLTEDGILTQGNEQVYIPQKELGVLMPGSYKSSGLAKTELFISKECVSNIFSTK